MTATVAGVGEGVGRVRNLGAQVWRIVRRNPLLWVLAVFLPPVVTHYYSLAYNNTESLPQAFFLIEKRAEVGRGDYAAYVMRGETPYGRNRQFVKIVAGIPGDFVTVIGRDYFINGMYVGTAKEYSLTGKPLEIADTGVIGEGRYYVMAPHKDSLDSRYAMAGWIGDGDMLGRAYALY